MALMSLVDIKSIELPSLMDWLLFLRRTFHLCNFLSFDEFCNICHRMNQITAWDHLIFRSVNSGLANPFFDLLMPFMRYAPVWIPVYVFFGVFLIYNFRWKGLYIILFGAVAVLASDQLCTAFIKPFVHRLRPCYDPDLAGQVRLLLGSCGGQFSFPSNHASNHFAIALYLISILPSNIKWLKPTLLVWASLIAFAQVYVGVHFPLDVICGAIIGSLLGALLASIGKVVAGIDLDKDLEGSKPND